MKQRSASYTMPAFKPGNLLTQQNHPENQQTVSANLPAAALNLLQQPLLVVHQSLHQLES